MVHVKESLIKVVCVNLGTCFTDLIYKVALYWVQGVSKIWKQFVLNKVTKIWELMPVINWCYCPGKENPADLPS